MSSGTTSKVFFFNAVYFYLMHRQSENGYNFKKERMIILLFRNARTNLLMVLM